MNVSIAVLPLVAALLPLAMSAPAQDFPPPADLPAQPELPDPFAMRDGSTVETPEDWMRKRRPEVLRLFEHYVYGKPPAVPSTESLTFEARFEKEVFGGKGTLKEVVIRYPPEGTPPIHLLVAIPKGDGPAPVFVGLNFGGNHATTDDPDVKLSEVWLPNRYEGVENHRATERARGRASDRWPFELALDRGYAMATLYHGDLDPDRPEFGDGVHPQFYGEGQDEPAPGEWGTLGAWAWGLSLAASCLVEDPAVDADRIGVMGHSRNGKAALWAGARDERFAVVVSNHSGCGGAALSRPRMGETLADINENFPHWFNDRFPEFDDREDHLPVDQHLLLALVAPRPVLVCSAVGDGWASPAEEFGSCVGADPVYRLLGRDGLAERKIQPNLIGGTIGYHIRPGGHGVGAEDWAVHFDFADEHLE